MTNLNSRNARMADAFAEFCAQNPDQRFWQALRNWIREYEDADVHYILLAPEGFYDRESVSDAEALELLRDTFYL